MSLNVPKSGTPAHVCRSGATREVIATNIQAFRDLPEGHLMRIVEGGGENENFSDVQKDIAEIVLLEKQRTKDEISNEIFKGLVKIHISKMISEKGCENENELQQAFYNAGFVLD